MKRSLMMLACVFFAVCVSAQDCVKNLRGETVCKKGQTAAVVNPNTGNAAVAHTNSNGVTTTQTSNGTTVKSKNGVGVAQQTNQNGVTTTKTSTGGTAKTRNGKGVATGPGGTTCVKTANNQGCTK